MKEIMRTSDLDDERAAMHGQSILKTNRAKVHCRLGNAWERKSKIEAAIAAYQKALHIDPDYVPAYLYLAGLLRQQKRLREAFEHYEKALALNPHDADVRFHRNTLKDLLEKKTGEPTTPLNRGNLPLTDNPEGKLNLLNQRTFKCHRSGWNYVLNALAPLHNSKGILFDGFLENNFAWRHTHEGVRTAYELEQLRHEGRFEQCATSEEKGITPYKTPWAGFLHNPQGMPGWLHYQESPQAILQKDIWKRSLPFCKGLFTFSEYHGHWLRERTGKPVSTLIHPTEIPELQFDFIKFKANPLKKIIQIGWWLRKLNAIYQLPLTRDNPLRYEKIRLVPVFSDNADHYLKTLMDRDREINRISLDPDFSQNTREILHVSDDDYDQLLSENIAFVSLYDANANNAVVECIARATPLLVNPLPAVQEYLGTEYPMYFSSLPEAAEKALDTGLISETHEYLKNCEIRSKLGAAYFLKSFTESEVYQSI